MIAGVEQPTVPELVEELRARGLDPGRVLEAAARLLAERDPRAAAMLAALGGAGADAEPAGLEGLGLGP